MCVVLPMLLPPVPCMWCSACSTLNSAAGKCGASGCEDLVLQASGVSYRLDRVATSRQPVVPTYTCTGGIVREPNGLQGVFTDIQLEQLLNVSRVQPAPDPTEELVYVGAAYVYSSPVTVRSRVHEAKWQQGWADFIVPLVPYGMVPVSVLKSLPYKVPFVDPEHFWAYRLELNRAEEGHPGYARDRE